MFVLRWKCDDNAPFYGRTWTDDPRAAYQYQTREDAQDVFDSERFEVLTLDHALGLALNTEGANVRSS